MFSWIFNRGIKINWYEIGYCSFVGECEGYIIELKAGIGSAIWNIRQRGVVVDVCFRYVPSRGEIAGKKQVRKILNKIIKQK